MNPVVIGKRLEKLRGSKSQAETARELGITYQSYWMYETGRRVPRDEVKKRIAAYYRMTVDEIFYE